MKVFVIGTISGDFMLPPSGGRSQNHSVDNKGRDHPTFVLFNSLSKYASMLFLLAPTGALFVTVVYYSI